MYNIKTLRGTIFCPPIKYSKEFVSSIADLVNGYIPVIVRDNGALPIFPIWQLTSPDEKEILLFNGEKIDFVQIVEDDINDKQIQTFSEHCKNIFVKIMEVNNCVCTRIAIAPSVIIKEKENLFNRLFSIKKFHDVDLDTSNISQVYRLSKKIGNRNITINHVANFRVESEIVPMNGINQIRELFLGDFDINTMVNSEYKFSKTDIQEFFEISPSFFTELYNLYFSL